MPHSAFLSLGGKGNLAYNAWNRAVLTLLESGEVERLRRKWWKDSQCPAFIGGGAGGGSAQPFCHWHLSEEHDD